MPPELYSGLGYPEKRRGEIEKYLFSECVNKMIESENYCQKRVKESPDQVVRAADLPGKYFYYRSIDDVFFVYSVKNIKPGRPWTIRCEKGREYIYYFRNDEDFEIVNQETLYSVDGEDLNEKKLDKQK